MRYFDLPAAHKVTRPEPRSFGGHSERFGHMPSIRPSTLARCSGPRALAISLGFLLTCLFQAADGATEAAKEFNQLLLDREKAIEEWRAPIEQRFAVEMENLLREATESKDFDVVVRLTQAIEKLKAEREDRELKPSVIGTWGFSNKADGHAAVVELNADQSYTVGGKQIGRWEIRDKQIMVTYAQGGHQDRYSLPAKEEKLTGTNHLGHHLTLRRLAD